MLLDAFSVGFESSKLHTCFICSFFAFSKKSISFVFDKKASNTRLLKFLPSKK
jgi:hypothetical protein